MIIVTTSIPRISTPLSPLITYENALKLVYLSCHLKFDSAENGASVGTPPVRVIAFRTTVLRAQWTDFNNFLIFGKFRGSSECPDSFLVFLNQTCLFQNQISKMSCVFLLYLGYIQATGWGPCRCLRSVLSGGNGRKTQALSFPLLRTGGRCLYG